MNKFAKLKPVLLVIAGIYIVATLVNQQITMLNQKREVKKWEQEIVQVREENRSLNDNVIMSEQEDYIERVGREKLGLIKEDEVTIMNKNED